MDTTAKMNELLESISDQAETHKELTAPESFCGGVVQLVICKQCGRYAFGKIYFDQPEITGSLTTGKCETIA